MATITQPGSGRPDPLAGLPETEAASLGELLRRARTARGLSLEQVARETRIPAHHLEALERGDLSAVPSAFYRRAETRTYARAIRLDVALALAHLDRALTGEQANVRAGQPPDSPAPLPGSFRPGRLRGTLLPALALLAAIAALSAPFWRAPTGLEDAPSGPASGAAEPWTAMPPAASDDEPVAAGTVEPRAAPATSPEQTPSGPALEFAAALPPVATDAAPNGSADAAPSAPPRSASAAATGLVITTQPSGARVTVNGIGYGVTPVTIPYLPPGAKRIRVTLDGHRAEERVVQVTEVRRRTVAIPLRAVP